MKPKLSKGDVEYVNYLFHEKAYNFCFNSKKSFVRLKMAFQLSLILLNFKGVGLPQLNIKSVVRCIPSGVTFMSLKSVHTNGMSLNPTQHILCIQ